MVVALFQIESELIVTFELELEKSRVIPEGVVMDAPPTAFTFEVQPPNRIVFAPLVWIPNVTPRESALVELSPFSVMGPLAAKMSIKSKYKPSALLLVLLLEPIPVRVIPPPGAVARICVP
jgi:hypothetical protein